VLRILEPLALPGQGLSLPRRVLGAGSEWGRWVLAWGWVPGAGARLSPCRCAQLSTPDKVLIPERYVELEPDTPLSPEEMKEKQKKVERIKTLIAKSR